MTKPAYGHANPDNWNAWKSFESPNPKYSDETVQARNFLKDIADHYGRDNLRTAWTKCCNALIQRPEVKNTEIPDVQFSDILDDKLSDEQIEKMKDVGCFVVRNVIEKQEADDLFQRFLEFRQANISKIQGSPAENPSMLRLYWTELQVTLRGHPNQLKMQRWINELWVDSSNSGEFDPQPLTYVDALRIRPAGVRMVGLGPHIDAGSLSRWADETYREVYGSVFEGKPEELYMYDMKYRKDAQQRRYGSGSHCSAFRSFQGWTAVTPVAHEEGTMFVRPYPAETVAYVLLRPFFKSTLSPDDPKYLDPDTWDFVPYDEMWLPGTFSDQSQYLSPKSHPHVQLEKTLVALPDVGPGDTVWWHCDMVHAVDIDHHGDNFAGVIYIPAVPTIPMNTKYVKEQAESFKKGDIPYDFATHYKESETTMEGFQGVSLLDGNPAGRKAMML